jgi:Tol biopolymer transport system component
MDVGFDGNPGRSSGSSPAVSADGAYIAFSSFSSTFDAADTNNASDIFIRRVNGFSLSRVTSVGNANSFNPRLSSDARYIAFDSAATNLVATDTNSATDVFVIDQGAFGAIGRANVGPANAQATGGDSRLSAMSGNGRYVVFESAATNLVTGDTNGATDVFVRDRAAGTTSRVSIGAAAVQANGASNGGAVSDDGRFVAFTSSASNLVANDTNAAPDVFVRDRQTGVTTRMSVTDGGSQATGGSGEPTMSGDGRFVAFTSSASNLVTGDDNRAYDVFVRDLTAGRTWRVSTDQLLHQLDGASFAPAMSRDGKYVAFATEATNAAPGDSNGEPDVVVRAVVVPHITGVSPATITRGSTATLTITGTGFTAGPQVMLGDGITVNATQWNSETSVTVTASVAPNAPTGGHDIFLGNPGTGPGSSSGAADICFGCLRVN